MAEGFGNIQTLLNFFQEVVHVVEFVTSNLSIQLDLNLSLGTVYSLEYLITFVQECRFVEYSTE